MAAGGQEITGEQGSLGNSVTTPLRSRKAGGGAASFALSGQSVGFSQGAFGISRTRALSGSASSALTGSVTASGATQPASGGDDLDWQFRSTRDTEVVVQHFDDSSELGANWTSDPNGDFTTARFGTQSGAGSNGTTASIDTTVKVGSGGSMRFIVPSQSEANSAGAWTTKWPTILNGSTYQTLGPSAKIGCQFRFRMNAGFLQICDLFAGTKVFEFGDGTFTRMPAIVFQTWNSTLIAHLYSYNSQTSPGLFQWNPDSSIYLQNGQSPFCPYPGDSGSTCFVFTADEWITARFQIDGLGARNAQYFDFRCRFWLKRYGQTPRLITDYITNSTPGSQLSLEGFGSTGPSYNLPGDSGGWHRLKFFPYTTSKNPATSHAEGRIWIDEFIAWVGDGVGIPDPLDGLPSWMNT